MKTILAAVALAIGLAGNAYAACGYGAPPPPPTPSAEAFLHSIYDRYIGPEEKTRPIDYSQESELRKYFDPSLVAMIMKDFAAAAKVDEVPTLDGDPFVGSQEWDIPSFDIKVTPGDADHATATVKFTNYGKAMVVRVTLVKFSGEWRAWDIDWGGDAGTLRGLYKGQH